MRKSSVAVLVGAFCISAAAGVAKAAASAPPRITADAAIVMDCASGTVLYEKHADRPMHPASITKMMTAILALERGYLGDVVTVSREAALTEGSSMGLAPGSRFLLEDLLSGLMIVSGNDAAVAIAEHLAGSEQAFVEMMNARAKEIGAVNTRFVNPHGLSDPGHLSTAYDLALMARHGLSIPYFARLVATREKDAWRLDRLNDLPLANTNRLLWGFQGADGVKTGTTGPAGQCLCSSATRNGMKVIAVVLHADSRWEDSEKLLEYAFENFEPVRSFGKGERIGRVSVLRGMKSYVEAVTAHNLEGVVAKGEDATLRMSIDVDKRVEAPVTRGQRLGAVTLWSRDRMVATAEVVASENVERRTLLRTMVGIYAPALRFLSRGGVG